MVKRELQTIVVTAILLAIAIVAWYELSLSQTNGTYKHKSKAASGHTDMTFKDADKAGYVVAGPGGYFNVEKLEAFYQAVQDRQKSQLSIARYTDEGDPIFVDLDFDGQSIDYVYDTSWDAFGGQDKGVRKTKCEVINKRTGAYGEDYGTTYVLSKCAADIGYSDSEKKEYHLLFISQGR
ncbi:DUF4362 domain-containing protein [Paenibacillus rhizovicinus]|uniref:DUF4362 domain-containing protein n=1 Tax=Paenibacillus rhizovicinus TaxID=2704463 RepID=A0A6C0P007_9BACL|nr:DUF4362 domain-containing protein [Paenibacillus rhizovicinus]QHW31815.1 DUF4362 domain-containing protein [Paenibacillus rhizovicinus]